MAETENPDNSDDSDATEGETNEEEGDGSDVTPDDNETPVTDPEETDGETDPAETETPEEPEEQEPVTPEEESSEEDTSSVNTEGEPMPLESGKSVTVTISGTAANLTAPAENETDYTADGTGAKVTFTGGLATTEGTTTTNESDLVFKVEAKENYQLDTVSYKVGEGEGETLSLSDDKKSAAATISAGDINGDVAITVTVKQLHSVTFTIDEHAGVTRTNAAGEIIGEITNESPVLVPDGETLTFMASPLDMEEYGSVVVKQGTTVLNPSNGDNAHGTYTTDAITADATISVEAVAVWSTVTINTASDSDADAIVDFDEAVNVTDHRIKNDKDVTFVVTVSDPEKKIKGITCGYGSENKTVAVTKVTDEGAAENTYKIAKNVIAGLDEDTALTVKVELETKKYELTLPNGTASGITWKYKGGTVTEFAETTGTAIEITATDTITLQASVDAGSDKKYRVTVGGLSDEAETVDKGHTAEWTITKASFGTEETLVLSDGKTSVVELVDIEVKGAAESDTFTVKYFALDGKKTEEDALKADAVYAAAANNKILDQPVGTAIYVQITATGDAAGREVQSITGATAKYGAIGTVYMVTPVTAATGANVVTVTLDTAAAKVVNVTKDDHVKTVQYAPGSGTPDRIVPGSGKINLLSTETAVAIKVAAVENYEVAYVHTEKDKEHKEEDCGAHCLTPDASGVYAVTLANEGDTEVEIATKKAMVEYTVAGDSLAKLDVKIEAAAADGAEPEVKKDTPNTYLLGSGDKYYVSAAEKVEEGKEPTIKSITAVSSAANEDGFKMNANVKKYQFTPKKSDTASKTITFTATEKANKAVTFATAGAELETKAIKTGAYKSLDDGAVAEKPAAADFAEIAASYDVYEGTSFSFQLKTKANYVIDKLTYVVDGETKTIEADTAGNYSLASVDADTEITVTTKLDKTNAYGIKVKENPYITAATISWAGTDTLDDTLTVGEETLNLLTGNTAETVNVAFTAKGGYSVIGVKNGTADVTKPEGKDYYQLKLTKGQTAELDVTVKADANTTADKYLKLVPAGSGIKPKIAVTPATLPVVGVDETGNSIYKMAKTVKDADGKVTTQGIDEITVDVTVAEGYTLNSAAAVASGAVSLGEKDGKHSFTINAHDVSGESQKAATAYTFTASKRMVTLKLDAASSAVSSAKKYTAVGSYGQNVTLSTSGVSVNSGDKIVVTVKPGDKLFVNGKEVTLSNNSYTEVVELGKGLNADGTAAGDIYTFKAVAKEEYKVAYEITHDDAVKGSGKVDGSEIDVTYGDKVTLSLDGNYADSKILSAKVTGEGTPASTAAVQKESENSQNNVAVVDVKDGGTPFEVVLTVETDSTTEYKTTELAPISFSTQTTVTDVTVKGIQKGKVNRLDATSRMTYPLTLKSGRVTLNAKDYEDMLTAAAADAAVADVAIVDGNLVIETKTTGQTTVTIKSVTQAGTEDSLFTFTVEGQDPKKKLKVKSLASSAQGMNDLYLDMTPDAGIKEVSSAFDYYYEVNAAWKKGNDETAANHNTGYYYYPAEVVDNKLQALSQNMIVNQIDPETKGDKCGNTYTFSAKMIAVKDGSSVTTGSAQASAYTLKEGEFASERALAKDFSTRNKYYEDKLGVTKKTTKLYSGQEDVVVAVPKFSKNASHIDDVKVTVCNIDGTVYVGDEYDDEDYAMTAAWNEETNTISMSVGDYVEPGKYNLLIEATAHNSAAETGGVVYDMYRAQATAAITVVRGITSISVDVPQQIAVVNKDASITLKPTGYNYGYKAATQKFTYALSRTSNPKNKDNVIVKNNKITVKKDFLVGADPENNKFTVVITPADYVGNTNVRNVVIEVTNEALVPTEIYLADSNGEALPTSLTTLEAEGAKVVVKAGSRTVSSSLLTFTPAWNGKKTGISSGTLHVNGKGALSLKATTKDGGKKSVTKREKYNIAFPTDVTYTLDPSNTNGVGIYWKDGKYQYADTGSGLLYIQVKAAVTNGMPSGAETEFFSYSVSVSGGKIVYKDVADGEYLIAPNKKEMTITVTDKANRNKKIPFTFVNTNFKEAKAPAASTKDKLYLAYDEPDEDGYTTVKAQSLTFAVKNNTAGCDYVKFAGADDRSSGIVDLEGEYKIENDSFTINGITPYSVGTAKYNLVYGTKKNGIFYPATKAAAISVKVNKLANMKPVTKFTINPVESLGAQITYKPVDGVMYFDRVVSANVGGRKNRFFEFFEVDGSKLQIKTDMYAKLSAALAADAKNGNADFNPKEDLTGYLEYHYYTVNGRVDKADKITVTIKENQNVKYAASAVNVLGVSGVEAVTAVTLGKSEVKIASAKAVTDGWTATAVKDGEAATNLVTLKCTGTPAKGKVEFYVIPADSPQKASTDYEKYGVKVSANVTVLADDSTAKVKVDTKKNLTHTAAITDTTVTLTAEAVQGEAFSLVAGGYVISKAEKAAAAESATDAEKAAADAVKTIAMKETAEGEAPTVVITLDRDKAIAAANRGIITVPVKLTFDKGTVKEEMISLKVKLGAVPTAAQVSDTVKAALNEHELTAEQIATPAAAKAAMEAYAANNVEIDPMSGIVIEKIEAKDADASKWGEGEGKSYAMNVTLKDVTAKAEATPIAPVEITVKKAAAEVTLEEAVSEAAGHIVGTKSENLPAGVTELVVTETTTADQIAAHLQAAVAKSTYEDKEFALVLVEVTGVTPATESAEGTFSYSYKVIHSLKSEWSSGYTLVSETSESVTLPKKAASTPAT